MKFHRRRLFRYFDYKWEIFTKFSFGMKSVKPCVLGEAQKVSLVRYLMRRFRKRYVFILRLTYGQEKTFKSVGARMSQGSGKFGDTQFLLNKNFPFLECWGIHSNYISRIFVRLKHKTSIKPFFISRPFF